MNHNGCFHRFLGITETYLVSILKCIIPLLFSGDVILNAAYASPSAIIGSISHSAKGINSSYQFGVSIIENAINYATDMI